MLTSDLATAARANAPPLSESQVDRYQPVEERPSRPFLASRGPWTRGARDAALAALLVLLVAAAGCGLTVNDHLREAESGAPDAVEEAIEAIGHLLARKEARSLTFDAGDEAAIGFLKKLALESSFRMQRAQAINALGQLRSVDFSAIFLRALDDPFWLCRYNAVLALRRHARESFVDPLIARLAKETIDELRLEIVKSLGHIGGEPALKALFEVFLNSGAAQSDERVHAHRSLRTLTGRDLGFHERKKWAAVYEEIFATSTGNPSPRPEAAPAGALTGR